MGELLALLVCILGLASYAGLLFVFPAGVLLKIVSIPGMGFTAVASIGTLGELSAVSTTEAATPEINLVTLIVVVLGVFFASETVRKVKHDGRL